ncbi:hypothetical protein [Colwellia echini]|uniref:Uncharacterized protein n=1 Tax=Colwellia echini TaxID=1982103 RepID=A0ABY3MST4_9GAMM|nr:hypothetical protein [Colwellia echini]TYK64262.1 hypothetical protein CWS31_016660 [Colwellia echini]
MFNSPENNHQISDSHFIQAKDNLNSHNSNNDNLWDQLNLNQQFSVCSLGEFGYMLTSIRAIAGHRLAILTKNNKVATVNSTGVINFSPTINCP